LARRTKRLWTDEEKRTICFQTAASGVNAGSKLAHLAEVKLAHPGEEQARARGVSA